MKRKFVRILALCALTSLQACEWSPSRAGRVSVILIVMDSARADGLSSYRGGQTTTPNLDTLAKEAVLFRRAVAPAPWTIPSHASLFTGLYPWEHGVEAQKRGVGTSVIPSLEGVVPAIPAGASVLAEALSASGYRTAGISANSWLVPELGFHRGFQSFEILSPIPDDPKRTARGETVTSRAQQWLAHNRKADFFLFLNYMDVHPPFVPPHKARLHHSLVVDSPVNGDIYASGDRDRSLGGEFSPGVKYWAGLRSLYDAEMTYLDAQIGSLLTFVRSDANLARAAIIVTSDHGQELGEGGLLGHGLSVNEPETRLPLIIYTGKRTGVRSDLVSLVDVHASILKLCGISAGSDLRGRDLSRAVQVEGRDEPAIVFSSSRLLPHYRRLLRSPLNQDTIAVYDSEYKLILGEEGYRRFSAVTSAGEDPVPDEIARKPMLRMLSLANVALAHSRTLREDGVSPRLSPEAEERLRALGYTAP